MTRPPALDATPARVLMVDPVGERGGAEVVLADLARRVDRARWRPRAVCLNPGPFVSELQALGIPAEGWPPHRVRRPDQVLATVLRFRRALRRFRIDLVHANGYNLLLTVGPAASRLGIPVVWHVHDPLVHGTGFERVHNWALRRHPPDATIFANPVVERSFRSAFRRLGRTELILPGVDTGPATGDAAGARRALGLPPDAEVVSMFARLQAHKGQQHLVAAAPGIIEAVPSAHVVLAGGALFGTGEDHADRLRAQIDRLGLRGRVLLPGFVSEELRAGILAASSVVVHPADKEPFGIAVVEAMAASRPVVVTDAEGPASIVRDGETGLVVGRGDAAALGRAVIELLTDPDRAARLGAAARARAVAHHGVDVAVRRTTEVWTDVLSRRLGTRPS